MVYSGQDKAKPELVDLTGLVQEMSKLLKVSFSKHATLRLDLSKDVPYVWGNAVQIRQLVMNLIMNASEAIGEKIGVIHVQTSYDVLSTTTWFSSFARLKKRHCIWFPAEPSVAKNPHAERRAGGKGAAGFAAAKRTLVAEHRSATASATTDGAAGTRCLDSRWWVPERFHDASANTKFGKSSNTHLFFNVR
jgi:hypothetical protein